MQMTEGEARRRFAAARVLRLATVGSGGTPHVVPATFAVSADSVAVAVDHKPKRHTRLQRLRNIEANPHVALLVDHYSDDWARLWWVRADGEARVRTNEEVVGLVDQLAAKYPQYQRIRPAGPVIEITVRRWSGWQAA
ncbi:TIGR03668 family PPOX class F420-dependent oxidoreductase [Streptomyces iconiensis]|uniref:TIGR03668 family PPOX class F420-dependent oxidoreductase n=1 Tax=Streptomyces iconiensis TaxID=1384038 RepID=A0ABT7A8C3_9ACTN|nr:TIGR03668 family PPOX class F420-dependent oxidoreductase [Streptomyces iconiensis]MDJ1137579.1 TIGR03668 family PPOX class F420-dependent oxidoreductase [Streptomyces iconiensis]